MKYLRKFETEADVAMFIKPNVVLVNETGRVGFNVAPPNGVYIEHIDGRLLTTDQWTAGGYSNDEANGVAVLADEAKFVVAKTVLTATAWSSDTSTLVDGVAAETDSESAKKDYSGKTNTELIVATDTSGAAYQCSNYLFPNGEKGYLPALGELVVLDANKMAVNDALELLGSAQLSGSAVVYYWSSTQYDATNSWSLSGRSLFGRGLKSSNYRVLVFKPLSL